MGKILDIIIKIFTVLFVLFLLYCLTIGRDFGKQQINKIVGMYHVNLGDKAFKEHNMQQAINSYQTALELFPGHYEAWLNLGNIYVAYEDYFSATQAYENAIMAKNNYTQARMNLGIITAEKLGDFDGAINQYKAIISSKPRLITIPFVYDNRKSETANKAIAYYNMGKAYSQKAFYIPKENKSEKDELLNKALTAYENAVNIVKNDYNMLYNLALTYHIIGDYRHAGQYYCEAIKTEPMNYEAHYNLGLMLRHLHQDTYAIDELEKAAVLSSSKYQNNSKYIFDILSSVSMSALQKGVSTKITDEDKEKSDSSEENKTNTKEEDDDESENSFIESFRKCNSRDLFKLN